MGVIGFVLGRIMGGPPKMSTSYSPKCVTMTSHGKEDFAEVIKDHEMGRFRVREMV